MESTDQLTDCGVQYAQYEEKLELENENILLNKD
jgi:hypothetical protein